MPNKPHLERPNIELSCAAESPARSEPQHRHGTKQKTALGDNCNDLLGVQGYGSSYSVNEE